MEEDYEEGYESEESGKLVGILIVLVLFLLIGVGVIGYMMYNKSDQQMVVEHTTNKPIDNAQNTLQTNDIPSSSLYSAKVANLVLNITNAKGREKLMKLSFVVKSTNPSIESLIDINSAEIIDSVIAQISARTSEELLTVGGKTMLKEEMIEEINSILNASNSQNSSFPRNNIKKIFFTAFVIK